MRFLFLDIDGVLNARADFIRPDYSKIKNAPQVHTSYGQSYHGISQPRVARLKKIIDETGAKVVLTSSWKEYYNRYMRGEDDEHVGKYLVNALSRKDVRIYDTTERFEGRGSYYRGFGIICWLLDWKRRHPDEKIEGMTILDDEEFDYEVQGLKDWWIATDYETLDKPSSGLNDEKTEKAIRMLLLGDLPLKLKLVVATKDE